MSAQEQSGPEYPDVTLAIIAGGKGQRLGGVAKGLLVVDGRPVLEHLLALSPLFGDTLLVANEPAPYARFHVRTVGDAIPGRGAPGGVHAALDAARTEWVLAVACDMPFVSAEAVRPLLAARSTEVDAVCFEVGGRWEPLLAVYRRSLGTPWGKVLREEEPSLRRLLAGCRVRVLPEDALREVDRALRAVISVNTPEDLARHDVQRP